MFYTLTSDKTLKIIYEKKLKKNLIDTKDDQKTPGLLAGLLRLSYDASKPLVVCGILNSKRRKSLDLQKVFDSKDAYAISLRMKILLSIPAFFAGLVIRIFMSYINGIF